MHCRSVESTRTILCAAPLQIIRQISSISISSAYHCIMKCAHFPMSIIAKQMVSGNTPLMDAVASSLVERVQPRCTVDQKNRLSMYTISTFIDMASGDFGATLPWQV